MDFSGNFFRLIDGAVEHVGLSADRGSNVSQKQALNNFFFAYYLLKPITSTLMEG
jgi:hypothetical protein